MANLLRKLKIGSTEYPIQIGIHYGTCATAANTAAKVVTLTDSTGFELITGAIVAVKFTYANSVANPTLNVNSTGAKAIMRYGTTAVSTGTTTTGWIAGAIQMFVYDGTNWVRDYWNNTTYSLSTFGITATAAELNALPDHTHTVSHTPAGSVSKPTFTGSAVTSGTPSGSSSVASSTHTHSVTAAGSVSQPTFTGTEATLEVDFTPAGTVSKPSFTGSAATSGTPSGTATVASSTHTHEYTPAGTVSTPSFTGSAVNSGKPDTTNVTTIYSITGVGSLPSHTYTAPSFSGTVANQCLTLSFSAGSHSFSAGSLPSRSSAISMPNANHTHSVTASGSVSQPTFTGTEASTTSISGTASVASSTHTHSVTAKGSVSTPTFTGTEDTISITYTPAGTVSKPTFSGTAVTSGKPSASTSVASSGHTHDVTAEGSVSQPTFTGTAVSLTTSTPQ